MVTKLKFSFRSFTGESFQATERAWLRRASGDFAFPTEAQQVLDWARNHLNPDVVNEAVAFGLFKDGTEVASAICEVVLTRRSARSHWVKMIKLRLSPELEKGVFEEDLDTARDIRDVYAAAVMGVLKLKFDREATTLKIYGRSAEQVGFLKLLGVELEKHLKNHKISIHDRWLVIETI